ncbi:MAG TPA: GntR family transcriptional regulator [Actinophytocola sp.]|uniref:GntR family transcriptional regulator n=1 Tax=Actinophytocola sp. TaxID=1872138 RepID=UPI002DBD6C53|nr:GntR family transcriptional regulator [Actinophytocola sp.]HEU5470279.1 GntR family transcriptional regulator [Actinophytocola sp.]
MHVIVSPVPGVPLYEQIVEQIRQQIMAGELAAGTPLPSLRALAAELRVSLITTTRAYNDLAAEGLIVNVPGKGSFVAQIDPEQARWDCLDRARAEFRQIVERTRHIGLVSLEELTAMLAQEWER